MPPKQFLKILTLIHASLCGSLLLFTLFAYFNNGDFQATMDSSDILIYIVPTLAAVGYFASKYLYQRLVSTIPAEEKLSQKLGKYQIASIIQYALLEGPGFVALVAYYWSGNAMYLVIALALTAYLITQRPKKQKLLGELPLSFDEKKQFDTLNS